MSGEFSGNGILDLALTNRSDNTVSVLLGDGDGTFQPGGFATGSGPDGIMARDFGRNGQLDLVVANSKDDTISVLMGDGDGTFQPYRQATETAELTVADLTANGSEDIIYADQGLDCVMADQSTALLEPGAVAPADLNGDGIPDLIVADSGSNKVLIDPGLGNGQFGPALSDGNGDFAGTNPVGITVADLTGPLPDLIVADKGSDQASILINQSQKKGTISFVEGPRLKSGGSGPSSTLVGHFTGGVYPDLLVINSGSDDVTLLPGVGPGFFNDQSPRVYDVGSDPAYSFAGTFGGRQSDLVTIDAGSIDLTVISGFESDDPVFSTFASGGVDPTTAFDFSTSPGFDDPVVGNTGDGALSLFEGGPEGLSLASVEEEPNVPDPTALAFSALTDGTVQFYAATAGREFAELVAISLSIQLETISNQRATVSTLIETVTGSGLLGAPPSGTGGGQLVSLHDSSLPLVATVLTLTISGSIEEQGQTLVETEALGAVATVAGLGTSAGQGPLSTSRGGGATSDPSVDSDDAEAVATVAPAVLAPWERSVLGLDEALEELGREGGAPDHGAGRADRPGRSAAGSQDAGAGVGPGLRSVLGRSPDVEQDVPDHATGPGTQSAHVDGWHPYIFVGMVFDPDGPLIGAREDGAMSPARVKEPRSTRAVAIDAAIAGLGRAPTRSDRGAIDPPMPRPALDEPRLAPMCLADSLLAARWGTLREGIGQPGPVDRPPTRVGGRRAATRVGVRRCRLVVGPILR